MNPHFIFALLVALTCTACGKQSAEPAAVATAESAAAPASESQGSSSPSPTEDAALAESEAPGINEPMPPLDEFETPPKVLARGPLKNLRPDLSISADIVIYQADDGSRLLRIENLLTPADQVLELALAHNADPTASTMLEGTQTIGALKGARGNMNYLVNRELDLSRQRSLVLMARGEATALAYIALVPP